MTKMPIVNLLEEARKLAETGQRVRVLWQQPDTLVFIARGREYWTRDEALEAARLSE